MPKILFSSRVPFEAGGPVYLHVLSCAMTRYDGQLTAWPKPCSVRWKLYLTSVARESFVWSFEPDASRQRVPFANNGVSMRLLLVSSEGGA